MMQDKPLQRAFVEAVVGVYSEKHPLHAGTDGLSIMYCFSAARDRQAPSVASEFVRDISRQSHAEDACALLLVSVPEMRVRSMLLYIVYCCMFYQERDCSCVAVD